MGEVNGYMDGGEIIIPLDGIRSKIIELRVLDLRSGNPTQETMRFEVPP